MAANLYKWFVSCGSPNRRCVMHACVAGLAVSDLHVVGPGNCPLQHPSTAAAAAAAGWGGEPQLTTYSLQ
jgi:hypothetical protein